ncbi:TatD family hydrolase [Methylotenera mobilis]|uniref:TatD-related deoxyribonuclease n=1 Tax=Methylotenera mobilis (strain JLW8 / ATCC BAA-1282 / DSM 17540) TaxID=583345 RepID=C6WX11_METML|nr:TatD family hydrolase [Methylotenera mobilis]ACT48460.1 TatD-related deoxyribonuclease [Methylotenera mobilis JLW8]
MLIDTHCHLDAAEFDADRDHIVCAAFENGVSGIVVPAVTRAYFDTVIKLCQDYPNCVYALGVHPMYVEQSALVDIDALRTYVQNHQPVAIGEIGLDYFLSTPSTHPENIKLQTHFFVEQLKIAQAYDLPVILHVRHAIDDVLKQLRKHKVCGGIAHAFNGSMQQAEQFMALGFKLGFGGAMTYSRALKIRALATQLPLEAIVLETDAPDIPPEWLGNAGRNSPAELMKIAQVLADLRQVDVAQVLDITGANAIKIMPKLADLCTPVNALH